MEKHENFFERLARERNITVEEMKQIISDRIKQGLHDHDPEKRKSWETIPCVGDVPTPEEWLKYAVEKLEVEGCDGKEVSQHTWDYEKITGHTFYLVPASDHYIQNDDGTFSYIEDESLETEQLLESAVELKIAGVIRPNDDAANANISTAVAYTSKLTDYIIEHTNESAVVLAQEASPEKNVLNGMIFEALDDTAKIADAKAYISALGVSDKASLYQMILYYNASNSEESDSEQSEQSVPQGGQMGAGAAGGMSMDETSLAAAMDNGLKKRRTMRFCSPFMMNILMALPTRIIWRLSAK